MPAPTISAPSTASATVGQSFSLQTSASGAPAFYKADYLPPQLYIDSVTGRIYGTPELAGTFKVNLYASNASGTSDPFVCNFTVNPVAATTGSTLVDVPGSTNPNAVSQLLSTQPNKTFRIVRSASGTNASLVKGSAGGVATVDGSNTTANPCYLKLYNKATVPVVGTDVPVYTKFLAAQDDFAVDWSGSPLAFSNGIGIAFTLQPDDTDTSGVALGDIMGVNVTYY